MGESLALPARVTLLSPHPARRALELYWLRYTVVWAAIAALVMVTGIAERWGDVELMLLGVGFAIGAVLPPIVRVHPSERELGWWQRTAFKLSASVTLFAFGMNYFCTPYFFEVLHMHFGFDVQIHIQHNPLFLYFMTVAYFATYAVLLCLAHRVLSGRSRLSRGVAWLAAPFAVAALETLLNANPFMRRLFCFDDLTFMLWFGTLSYGACFVFALPVWLRIDERPGETTSLARVVVRSLAALMLIVITFEVLRHLVAPHVTQVVEGARGLRDFGSSCLGPPP
jgi:cycloeucalenol cycloisomerase